MEVFRLTREKYLYAFDGKGASKFGNRWNSKGVRMIYTAESRALAMAEVAVHLSLVTLPKDFFMVQIHIPNNVTVRQINREKLSSHWNRNPAEKNTQLIGDSFIEKGRHCLLKVPSAVVQGDHNILINPAHPSFKNIHIIDKVKFPFDRRLF